MTGVAEARPVFEATGSTEDAASVRFTAAQRKTFAADLLGMYRHAA